jgi:hypothetical protein
MRLYHLTAIAGLSVPLLAGPRVFAAEPADKDASIGTTPAQTHAAPLAVEAGEVDADGPRYRSREAPMATDPPYNWAVMHAGVRPHLGTFGGISTFALAQARTERFYGGFSLATVRNDAGTHIGLAQLALGRNLADSFIGGVQLSVTENRARDFVGLGQTTLAYNRAGDMTALWQTASYNRTRVFRGVLQLGGYNRTDEAFDGVLQLGAYDHAIGDFSGLAQVGAVSAVGDEILGDGDRHRFAGVVQAGALSSIDGGFYGVSQVGLASYTSGSFRGLTQVGGLIAWAGDFRGLAQVGAATVSDRSIGAQVGAVAVAREEHSGLQLGVLGNYARSIDGAQIGVVNIARRVRGVQIGVFNHAQSLRGVQIGLANHAEDGILPWTAILNMGFGDGDGGGDDRVSEQPRGASID